MRPARPDRFIYDVHFKHRRRRYTGPGTEPEIGAAARRRRQMEKAAAKKAKVDGKPDNA